jgi:hypothetical protein
MSDQHGTAVAVIERSEQQAMSPVVAAGMRMLQLAPSPETLRELLAVQREWEANEARKAYASALVALKRDLPSVINRDKKVHFESRGGTTSYTHASLGNVIDQVTPALTQHGFSLAWRPSTGKDGVTVTCRLTHAAGHFEEATISAPADNSGGKNSVQGVASTITLLQRYSACSLLGIATADMEEPTSEHEKPGAGEKRAPSEKVDSTLNLRAVGWLKQRGRTAEAAETFLGRKVPDWTEADREKLKSWASSPAE